MYEVIISNINTGRVHRKVFATRDRAGQYAQTFVSEKAIPRNYRIEIEEHLIEPVLTDIDCRLIEPVLVPVGRPETVREAAA